MSEWYDVTVRMMDVCRLYPPSVLWLPVGEPGPPVAGVPQQHDHPSGRDADLHPELPGRRADHGLPAPAHRALRQAAKEPSLSPAPQR